MDSVERFWKGALLMVPLTVWGTLVGTFVVGALLGTVAGSLGTVIAFVGVGVAFVLWLVRSVSLARGMQGSQLAWGLGAAVLSGAVSSALVWLTLLAVTSAVCGEGCS